MQEKASDKFINLQSHLFKSATPVVFPGKEHFAVLYLNNTPVSNSNTKDVTREILKYFFGFSERLLNINHPFFF